MKVLLKSFHLIGHKVRFDLWTQNYKLHTFINIEHYIIELISLSKLPNLAILCASTTTAVSNRNVQRLVISCGKLNCFNFLRLKSITCVR